VGPDARVRRSAAYALGAFGPLASSTAGDLRTGLKDRDPAVRQNAAWALGRLGPDVGKAAIADLCDRLSDSNLLVKRDAAGALGALGKSGGREALREAAAPLLEMVKAKDEDAVVRKAGLEALALVASAEHQKDAADLYPLLDSKDANLARGAA
jgi:HEAT repeat protein